MDAPEPRHFTHQAPEVAPSQDAEYYSKGFGSTNQHNLPENGGKEDYAATPPRQRILGCTPKAFWLLVLLIVVILAIGAGVGGGLAANHNSQSAIQTNATSPATATASQTPSTTSSQTSSATPSFTSLNSGCKANDQTNFTPSNPTDTGASYVINGTALTYKIYCFANYADKTSGWNSGVSKLSVLKNITSLQACITSCAAYNAALVGDGFTPTWDQLCSGVVYYPGSETNSTNCDWNTGMNDTASLTNVYFGTNEEFDSAVLQWVN